MYCYVYKITDKKRNTYYIGSRQSSLPPNQDLGHIYFSSSCNRKFIKEQQEDPSQFEYEIIETFSDREEAYEYEKELIRQTKNDENCSNGRNVLGFETVDSRATKNTVSYLGKLIKLARKERGISEKELGEKINAGRSTIQRIETGNTKVCIGSVFEACFVLGIPLMGCDKKHVNNLSRMLSYMHKIIPISGIQNISQNVNDDF